MTDKEIAYRFIKNFQKTNPKESSLILLNSCYSLIGFECFNWADTPEGSSFWYKFCMRMDCNQDKIRKFLKINYFDTKSKKNFINLQFIL